MRRTYNRARRLGIAKLDLFGVVVDCNDTFADILDGDRAAVIGKSVITDFTFPQDQKLAQERFRALQTGETEAISSNKTLRTLSGGTADIYVEACLIRNESGQPEYVIDGVWIDHDKETESRIDEFEALIESLRTQISSGNQIHIGHNTSAGGDMIGRDKSLNSQPPMWAVLGLIFGGLTLVMLTTFISILVVQWLTSR